MARKASVESPMDITEDKRKNEVELTAIKRAMRNTRWWKVFITVFMIAGIVAPVISIHAISTLQDMGSMLSAKYKEISVDKPGKQAALASVNKWLDTNKGPFRYGTTNLLWDSATKVGSSDEDTGTGKEHTDWWSHQFSLTDLSDGSTRDVTQLISWKNNVATAVGDPTVLPLKASGAGGAQSYTPSGYSRIDQAASFQNVVNAWAKAYIGKDSNAFTVLVGDPNSEHAYQPAAIGTFKNVSINWLVECDKNGQSVPMTRLPMLRRRSASHSNRMPRCKTVPIREATRHLRTTPAARPSRRTSPYWSRTLHPVTRRSSTGERMAASGR